MVIAATYLLFISGSVTLCRLLQRNPRFYYRKRHFVSVSSLVYRMKRNGAGLASICILGTLVLVMISSSTCLYFGAEASLHTRYPRDANITAYFPDRASQSGDLTSLRTAVADAVRRSGMSAANVWEYRSVSSVMTLRDGVLSPNEGFGNPVDVTLIPLADYNAAKDTDLTLPQGHEYDSLSRPGYQGTSLTLQNGPTWQVAGLLDNFSPSGSDSASVVTQLWLIVPALSAADALEQVMNRANMGVSRTWYYGFDLDRQLPDAADPVAEAIRRMAQDGGLMENGVLSVESLAENRGDFYGSYGSLFFLGFLLSVGFSLAAVLIIYYKQISEGYEDQARFDIMQKVGMTRRDIRSSINSQLLLVFFLPLLLAGLHLAFAFPFGTPACWWAPPPPASWPLPCCTPWCTGSPPTPITTSSAGEGSGNAPVCLPGGAVVRRSGDGGPGRCRRPDRVPHRPPPAHAGAIKHKKRPYSEEYGLF